MKYLSFSLILVAPLAVADQIGNQVNEQFNQFQQQNKQNIQQIQQYQKQRWLKLHQYQAKERENIEQSASQQCLNYQAIRFVGFTLIDPETVAPKKNECLNEQRLNQLSRDLTALYLDKGYIHNPFQFEDDQSGTLIMRVSESRVTKLSSDNPMLNLSMLFPNMVGKPLNIRDLDQGLDQANKMQGSQVSVDVLPSANGDVELAFTQQQISRINGFIGIDNFANKQHKRWQGKLGINIDNPFGLSDTLFVNLNHTLRSVQRDFSRGVGLYYSMPYGYWTLSSSLGYSQFHTTIPLLYSNAEQRGNSWQANIKADYTFHRASNHISNIAIQLEHSENKSYFLDSLLNLQSPKLSTIQISLNHLQLLQNGSFIANLSYERGFKWWNATVNQGNDQPEGQFNKWNLELYFQYYYHLGTQILHQSQSLQGQYSRNYLPANKQADLLGRYSVRGFNDLAFSAEKSLILQNNLGWLHQYKQWQIEPYLGLDIGIQKNTGIDKSVNKAIGYALGLKLVRPNWNIQLEAARGRLLSSGNSVKKEQSLSLNANLTW